MAGELVGKIGTQAINTQTKTAGSATGKDGPSSFDEIKDAKKASAPPEVPPLVETLDVQQQKAAETRLVKRMESKSGPAVFQEDLSHAKRGISMQSKKVQQLPKTPDYDPLRKRMTVLEDQYQATEQIVKKLGSMENPKELLKVQVELYKVTQNIELFSKVVESATSSTKQLLQTQVG